jgi:hypothetical protein
MMMRFTLAFLIILGFFYLSAQDIPKDVVFRLQQVQFIKNNQLPVLVELLPRYINTDNSEYKGELAPDSVFYYSSLLSLSEVDNESIFNSYWMGRIYKSNLTISGFSSPEPLPKTINSKKYYNINFTFNEARNIIFFTRCSKTAYPHLICDIWKSNLQDAEWQKAEKLPEEINQPFCNNTQPQLVEFPNYSVLYFVSNRPGSEGGLDIWYSIYKNGRFETPVNLGPLINTQGNEVTPFYNKWDETLYFSSDEHIGIGGYDIFYSKGALSSWSEPTNLGVPFNSEYNDVYLTINQNHQSGFFSSNRPNKKYSHRECCNDIYAYQWNFPKDTVKQIVVVDTVSKLEQIKPLIPLTLFFNNDEPDPKSDALITNKNYRLTISNYLSVKEKFKQEYARGLTADEQLIAKQAIETFFKDSVEKGYYRLLDFCNIVKEILDGGQTVTITVEGYASALHQSDYNFKLSSRRISSFVNFLREYNDGELLPYLNGEKNNQLRIIEVPLGSREAIAKNLSANLHDQRNSVYSIAASIERRIQVVNIKID